MNKIDCIVCGRKGVGIPNQRIHEGWCWGCIRNKMEGRSYNSYGKPWKEEGDNFLSDCYKQDERKRKTGIYGN